MGYSFTSFDSKVAYECCTIIIMFLFTTARVISQRAQISNQRRRHGVLKSEIFSTACLIVTAIFVFIQCGYSLNESVETKTIDESPNADELYAIYDAKPSTMFSTFFQLTLHTISVWLLKGCYVGYFHSMSEVLNKRLRWGLYATSAYCLVGLLASLFMVCFWCSPAPISINWNPTYDEVTGARTSCRVFNSIPAFSILTSLNIAGDMMIALLSIFIIRSINITSRSVMVAVIVIIFVGFLSIVAAIGRLILFLYIYTSPPGDWSRFTPANIVWIQLLVRIEVLFGTLAYGFAFGRVFVKKFVEGLVALTSRITGGSGSGSRTGTNASKSLGSSNHSRGMRIDEVSSGSLASLRSRDEGKDEEYRMEAVNVPNKQYDWRN